MTGGAYSQVSSLAAERLLWHGVHR